MTRSRALQDMALFVEVGKYNSFSRAALALEVPVSSLSRRISQLEERIGVRLLDRTTRKLTLTSYGEAFYGQAVRVVEEAQRAYDDVTANARGPSGLLKIAVQANGWVLDHFSTIISEYMAANPQVKVQLDLNHGTIDLMSDRYDLALMLEHPRENSLIVRKVLEIENAIFAAPAYLEEWGRPQAPPDLADHHVIVAGREATWSLSRDGETASVTVSGPASSNSPTLARRLAVDGHGLFACDAQHVKPDVESGALVQVMPGWQLQTTSFYIVTTSRLLSARARRFIDFASSRFTSLAGLDPDARIEREAIGHAAA